MWVLRSNPYESRGGMRPPATSLLNQVFTALGCLLLVNASVRAAETAYSALRLVGTKYGEEALNGLVEVHGAGGNWKVVFKDPAAPESLREVRIRKGAVKTSGAPTGPVRGSVPINVDQLNLDSDGVLTTINQQLPSPVGEDAVNFTLSTANPGDAPVWTVVLRDRRPGEIYAMQIAASDGTILQSVAKPAEGRADLTDAGRVAADEEKPRKKHSSRSRTALHRAPEVLDEIAEQVRRPTRLLRPFFGN